MSTGQVIQIAATAAGYYFGGPIGGFIGSTAGGLIGRQIDATSRMVYEQGPRLADLKVQTANYGTPIPRIYGRAVVAGNVIWSSDIIETQTASSSTQSAGKGGGGDSQTVNTTTYSYSVNLAIGLCAGSIAGIGKIWANGKLIYNGAAGTSAQTSLASQSLADGVRIYLGSETQLADPLIESYEGAGNVPGYRGVAYVLLEDFQLASFGNRIPQFEFEILASATSQLPGVLATIPTTTGGKTLSYDSGTYTLGSVSTTASDATFRRRVYDIDGNLLSDQSTTTTRSIGTALIPQGNWHGLTLLEQGTANAVFWNVETNKTSPAYWLGAIDNTPLQIEKGPTFAWLLYRTSANLAKLARVPILIADETDTAIDSSVPYSYSDVSLDLWTTSANDRIFFDGTWVWVADTTNGVLYRYTQDLVLSAQWTYTSPGGSHGYIYVFDDRFAIGPFAGVAGKIFQLNGDGTTTLVVSSSWDSGNIEIPYPPTPGSLIGLTKIVSVYPLLTASLATLSDIVAAECELSGLVAGDLDVTALTQTVRGYIATRAPLKNTLDPLAQAFFFDGIESDGKLKFVNRGGSSAVTIAQTDLAAHSPGEDPPDWVRHDHGMDLELPNEAAVLYYSDDSAYQQGAQYARRLATNALGQSTIELPLVLTDDEAVRVAQTLLFDAWAQREAFTFQTSRKFAKYEPGDVVTLPFPSSDTTDVRITKRDDGANGVIQWQGVFAEATVYSQANSGASGETPAETIALPGPTLLEAMDIPLLRDSDDIYGFYAAALGYLDGWRGAQVYVSRDTGATYDDMDNGLMLTEATIGFAETALGSPIWLEQFDEKCTVNVQLVEGTLSSVTRDQVLNGSNVALLGNEIVQFRTATQIATGRYTLSGLLRGRLGTDWAVGTHAINERFVLLDSAALHFLRSGSADIGIERILKAPSLGNTLGSAVENRFTYEAVNLKPLAPCNVGGGRDASGNLNLLWRRRTRLNATWRDYVDAPIGEVSESYEIDILNGATVLRTISAVTNSAQYTIAQQSTDWGSPIPLSISGNLYQLSERVGRGYAVSFTL